ncbi:hypothetical protein cyc_05312 [Cyclospora cayetanensis]|uniref:Uncharacterized protein n=1 Tax=Cyclospora cayetanensis TaxID=88456 RepID=A0A1D3CWL4_9EIME|nr:hypothetical protein cyc_05312 [Cyclospora cayetanensis]
MAPQHQQASVEQRQPISVQQQPHQKERQLARIGQPQYQYAENRQQALNSHLWQKQQLQPQHPLEQAEGQTVLGELQRIWERPVKSVAAQSGGLKQQQQNKQQHNALQKRQQQWHKHTQQWHHQYQAEGQQTQHQQEQPSTWSELHQHGFQQVTAPADITRKAANPLSRHSHNFQQPSGSQQQLYRSLCPAIGPPPYSTQQDGQRLNWEGQQLQHLEETEQGGLMITDSAIGNSFSPTPSCQSVDEDQTEEPLTPSRFSHRLQREFYEKMLQCIQSAREGHSGDCQK